MIDGSAATAVCLTQDGFDLLPTDLTAPVLLRSEVLAAIQAMEWRREISKDLAEVGAQRLFAAPILLIRRLEVYQEARRLAGQLGWAKTYDAEYVALARLTEAPLLTVDHRLASRVRTLIEVRFPEEL